MVAMSSDQDDSNVSLQIRMIAISTDQDISYVSPRTKYSVICTVCTVRITDTTRKRERPGE